MEVPTQRMRKEILEIRGFLTEGLFLALTPEERQALLASSQKLLDRLDALSDQVLVAGLVGGTGVGKSTVMNALAGAEIASTSHRRPNTDRVLLYRHEGVELPRALTKTAVPWHEVIHQADGVRQIIMCDLPDFDSLVGEHRERVLSFLEHLDVLVFVTSPEKYADHALYAFLEGVPKARPNFTFVLNKVDLLFQGEDLEPGYKQLASLAGLFQEYLQKAKVSEPLVFPVSAEEAFRNPVASPWNQFPAFRREIFRDREAKEVMAIKSSNLDQEVQELLSRLQAEVVHIDSLGRVLDEFARQFEDERGEWEKQGQEILDAWVDTRMKGYVLDRLETLAPLVGPGYGVARVVQEWRSWKGEKREEARPPSPEEASEPPGALRDQLESAENRVLHKALQGSVPASYRDRLQATLGIEGAWEAFSARWKQQVELRLLAQRAPLLRGVSRGAVHHVPDTPRASAHGPGGRRSREAVPGRSGLGLVLPGPVQHREEPVQHDRAGRCPHLRTDPGLPGGPLLQAVQGPPGEAGAKDPPHSQERPRPNLVGRAGPGPRSAEGLLERVGRATEGTGQAP